MSDKTESYADILKEGKPLVAFTRGSSMKPLLREGKTSVFIEPVSRELKRGDIPLYLRYDGRYQLHRIIKVNDDHYLIRGDNCIDSEKVSKDKVLGVVTEIYRNGKIIKITDPLYLIYVNIWMAAAPVRILIYSILRSVKKVIKYILRPARGG